MLPLLFSSTQLFFTDSSQLLIDLPNLSFAELSKFWLAVLYYLEMENSINILDNQNRLYITKKNELLSTECINYTTVDINLTAHMG